MALPCAHDPQQQARTRPGAISKLLFERIPGICNPLDRAATRGFDPAGTIKRLFLEPQNSARLPDLSPNQALRAKEHFSMTGKKIAVLCTRRPRTWGRSSAPIAKRYPHGRTSRRSRATNGSAGLNPRKSRRQGIAGSKGRVRISSMGIAAPAAGPVARIAEH